MSEFYTYVHIRGRLNAGFTYGSSARRYIDAEVAKGPYKREDFTMTDSTGRPIKAISSHGYNILETLRRTKDESETPDA